MPASEGMELAQIIRQNVSEVKKLCEGIGEETASRAPSGRWSPKQIISHLSGSDGIGLMAAIRRILEEDTPEIEIVAEDPFFSPRRSRMSMKELLAEFEGEYEGIARLIAGASPEQLARKAYIPLFRDTPLTAYPTLSAFVNGLAGWHMNFHLAHMKEVLQALGTA